MALQHYRTGARWNIWMWVDSETCAVLTTLESLQRDGHVDFEKLGSLLENTSNHGPPRNEQKCRPLKGGAACKGIWELKAPGGTRIAWFYGADHALVLTHCFRHGDSVKAQCLRASTIKNRYLEERDK